MNKRDKSIVQGLKRAAHRAKMLDLFEQAEIADDVIVALQDVTGMNVRQIPPHIEHLETVLKDIGLAHWIDGKFSLGELQAVQDAVKSTLNIAR